VSNTRAGATDTIVDSFAPGDAWAKNTPPPPSDTATAAPIAAHRDLHKPPPAMPDPFRIGSPVIDISLRGRNG
jgi:hypothetical protein